MSIFCPRAARYGSNDSPLKSALQAWVSGEDDSSPKQEKTYDAHPHIGIDESGKGDWFGPLVVAAVYVDEQSAVTLRKIGVCDSKTLSANKIQRLAGEIERHIPSEWRYVWAIELETYNQLYAKQQNMNLLLADAYAEVAQKVWQVTQAQTIVCDQFSQKAERLLHAFAKTGLPRPAQQHHAESVSIAVAAASILASAAFADALKELGEQAALEGPLPKGSSDKEKLEAAVHTIIQIQGIEVLSRYAKLHVKPLQKLLAGLDRATPDSQPTTAPSVTDVLAQLRQPQVDGLIELGSSLEELRKILIEQSQLLVEARQQREQLLSEVRGQRRQITRLERELQEMPAKFKQLRIDQSEQSASPPSAALLAHDSPYKGLLAFEKQDASYFFGREELEADLVHQLVQGKRFLAVIGPSGSGKSSLVQAGLLPRLETDTAHQLLGSRDWQLVLVNPGAEPLAQLADKMSVALLYGHLSGDVQLLDFVRRDLLERFRANPSELAQLIQQVLSTEPAHVRFLLIVDQFEEIFTRCRSDSERRRFIDALLYATESSASRAIVLLTMRADFYGHCAEHARLRDYIQDHHLLVGPLHENELRRVILEPARKVGLQIEEGLTETIIKDVADAPGALPLLSQALLETWKRRQGNTFTRDGYLASGGVREAIARTAETVYSQQLTAQQKQEARHLFLRLVEVGESEQYDTRRRTPRREIEDVAGEILVTLADARFIVTEYSSPLSSPPELGGIEGGRGIGGQGSVEVAHKALIREWPRLRNWLDDNREDLRLHRYLTEAAQEWERLGRDASALYRGLQLAKASEWAYNESHFNTLEEEFLRESQRAEEEARELGWWGWVVSGCLAMGGRVRKLAG